MNTKVTGQEAYDMMLAIESNKKNVGLHFHFNSPLWRAIRDHIESNECSIILKPDNIMTYRGTGQAIRLTKTHTYSTQFEKDKNSGETVPVVPDFFCLELEIEYYDEDYDRTYERSFTLQPPVDLLINFTKEKFDAWVEKQSTKVLSTARKDANEAISKILSGLPAELAKSLRDELK